MIRALSLAAGLAGAAGLSQFPEFSQQYLQRLAGQVDALTIVVKDFDASALAAGLGREEALEQLTGTPFLESRQADVRRTLARHARLADNLQTLRDAGPLARLALPHRMADPALLADTWQDFAPAVPLHSAGLVAGGAGFAGGWALMAALSGAVAGLWGRRRKRAAPAPAKRDPQLRRPAPAPDARPPVPRLDGVRR